MEMVKNDGLGSVSVEEKSGVGLPYAPVDWPNPDDVWTWKVGKRISADGFYKDRFIFLPRRLHQKGKRKYFDSKKIIIAYLRSEYPETDVDAFFKSFTWKVPVNFNIFREYDLVGNPLGAVRSTFEKAMVAGDTNPEGPLLIDGKDWGATQLFRQFLLDQPSALSQVPILDRTSLPHLQPNTLALARASWLWLGLQALAYGSGLFRSRSLFFFVPNQTCSQLPMVKSLPLFAVCFDALTIPMSPLDFLGVYQKAQER